jgi:DNA helicase-2/ATP-dependent DNA helicase PcrA
MPAALIEKVTSLRKSYPQRSFDEFPSAEPVKRIEKPIPQAGKIFSTGDRIFHNDFGIGQIQETYEGSMGLTYKILFDKDKSLKTLVAKYALINLI